jgi:hypothetical protein
MKKTAGYRIDLCACVFCKLANSQAQVCNTYFYIPTIGRGNRCVGRGTFWQNFNSNENGPKFGFSH